MPLLPAAPMSRSITWELSRAKLRNRRKMLLKRKLLRIPKRVIPTSQEKLKIPMCACYLKEPDEPEDDTWIRWTFTSLLCDRIFCPVHDCTIEELMEEL